MDSELSADLIQFIHACVPTYQAAEVLLFFAAHADRAFTPEEIVEAMRPVVVTVSAVDQYAALYVSRGVVIEQDGAFAYRPSSPELERAIEELAHAYNERPVTLINVIYRLTDGNIRSFSDAFKLRKE
jgi:hypothetical protein